MSKQISNHKKMNIGTSLFVICLGFSIWSLVFARSSLAQTLSLSVSPPLTEVMIVPGKSVSQTFTFTNDGESGNVKVYIIPFKAGDENGNAELNEKDIITSSSYYASWFSIISPVSSFGEKFYVAGGGRQDIAIKISPPENAAEKDYYFTILFEIENDTSSQLTGSGPTGKARIGTNLLVSLSRDGQPVKNLSILEFSAPKVIDSLGEMDFNVRIANEGSYFSKSNGQITIKPTFGESEILPLAPLNVISDSVRNIPCLKGEETVRCRSEKKVLVGIYKSTLEISADGSSPNQEKTVTTIAFPFSIALGIIFILITYRIIRKSRKIGSDST